jgi:hypothetical protein
MGYSGPSHRLISIVLLSKYSRRHFYKWDAAENAVFVCNGERYKTELDNQNGNIMHRELYACLQAIIFHLKYFCNSNLILYTHNQPVLYALRYGSMRFMHGCNSTLILTLLLSLIKATTQIDIRYVKTEENVADWRTRN